MKHTFVSIFKFLVLVLLVWLLVMGVQRLPSSYKFWEPLEPEAAPGPFTRYKLGRFKEDVAACENFLLRAGVDYRMLGDETAGECELPQQVLLQKSRFPYSGTVKATCPLVAALVLWERHSVQPASHVHLKSRVSRIDHVGIFSCRNVRGSSRPSQHANANAIDISGFQLANGTAVNIRRDWGKDTPAGRFLSSVHQHSCKLFSGVLGPDYNQLHADHFHLDAGPYAICR